MVYTFATFELDEPRMELRDGGAPIHLEPKNFELLRLLVANADRVVSKNEIFDTVWPGVFVTEASLSGAIKHIRKALGDDGRAQKYIRTVHGTGFRFVGALSGAAPVSPARAEDAPALAEAGPPVIAVLPFTLLGTAATDTAIAEAIPTEIIVALSRLRALKVIARGSSFRLTLQDHAPRDILARLGVTYLVTGSVELAGKHLRVAVELTDTRSEQVCWSESYQGALDDVFTVREAIVKAVITMVEQRVPQNEADRLAGVPTEALDAWGLYHLGVRHLFRFNGPDNAQAAQFFRLATERDPRFSRAIAGLSYTEFENFNLGFGSEKAAHRRNALQLAEDAVDLDPQDPFCNLVLGRARWIHEDIDGARSWTDRAVTLNPNYAFGHYNSGKFAAIACLSTVADAHVKSALSLSPLDPHLQSMLSARAFAAFTEDDAEQAVRYAEQSLRAPNAHLYICVIAASIFAHYGRTERIAPVLKRIETLGGGFGRDHFLMLFRPNDPSKARALIAAFDQLGF